MQTTIISQKKRKMDKDADEYDTDQLFNRLWAKNWPSTGDEDQSEDRFASVLK
jgi:hypothetical protein